MSSNLKLTLTESQIKFLELRKNHRYPLFKGGVGSGKSYCESIAIVLDMLECHNATVGAFAPTSAHVRDITLRNVLMRLQEFGFKEGEDFVLNRTEMKITGINPQLGNCWFKSLEDPDILVGYEFYRSHIDELDSIAKQYNLDKALRCWEQVLARTRQQPKGLSQDLMQWNAAYNKWEAFNSVSAYGTPEGYLITYLLWKPKQQDDPSYNEEYKFVNAKSRGNPYQSQTYLDDLERKFTEQQVNAYLNGEWVNMTSGTVYYAYDRRIHSSRETLQSKETLFIGMDFNVGRMCATVFVKRKGGDEWHAVAEIDDLLDTPNIIEAIQNKWQSKGHTIIVYPDASGKNRSSGNASTSSIQELRSAGFIIKAKTKNPLVVDRVASVNKAFIDGKIFINELTCPNRSDFLEQQSYAAGIPDKKYHGDHGNDSFGYPIVYEFGARNRLFPITLKFAQKTYK